MCAVITAGESEGEKHNFDQGEKKHLPCFLDCSLDTEQEKANTQRFSKKP